MSTKYEAYLMYSAIDMCVHSPQEFCGRLVSKKRLCFSESQGRLYFSFPTCQYELWRWVYGGAKRSHHLIFELHLLIPSARSVFLWVWSNFPSTQWKVSHWVQGELDEEGQSQFINHDTCPYSNLKASEVMGKASRWLQWSVEQMQMKVNN